MKNLSDDELMQKVAQGNEMAFTTLFDRHNGRFFGYVRNLIGDRNRAEDLTQDFWMKVIRLAESYRGKGHFVAWAYTLLRNSAFNELRANKKFSNSEVNDEIEAATCSVQEFEDSVLTRFTVDEVKNAISELPDSQRTALLLWGVEDLTYDEIAREMQVSLSSVKSLIFRARQALEKNLKPQRGAL